MRKLCTLLLPLLFLIYTNVVQAQAPSYWQCYAQDSNGQHWPVNGGAKQAAINHAWQQCKSHSNSPASCQAAKEWCQFYYQGIAQVDLWQCTALDRMGKHWPSGYRSNRSNAYHAAKQTCQDHSTMPSSCYVRLMTCKNNRQH